MGPLEGRALWGSSLQVVVDCDEPRTTYKGVMKNKKIASFSLVVLVSALALAFPPQPPGAARAAPAEGPGWPPSCSLGPPGCAVCVLLPSPPTPHVDEASTGAGACTSSWRPPRGTWAPAFALSPCCPQSCSWSGAPCPPSVVQASVWTAQT